MRIAYIVLTCQKYETTRMVWQKETVFSSIPMEDVFYLGHVMRPEDRLFSWGAGDDYDSLPYKFADFFRQSNLDYDWYFLMDDDTYVYTDRLQNKVKTIQEGGIDPRQVHYMEGHILTHIAYTRWGVYHSGGAGTLLSAKVYQEVRQMFQGITYEYRSPHVCADICLGVWTKNIPGIRIKHSDRYHTDMAQQGKDKVEEAITFHHLKTKEDYLLHYGYRNTSPVKIEDIKEDSI
jgi:hypothetical protein